MAKLITDERTKYTEHWVINVNKGKVTSAYKGFPEKNGYDYIHGNLDKTRIVVHELARLEEILKTGFLSEKVKEKIRKELTNV